jgi:hypothetical protein
MHIAILMSFGTIAVPGNHLLVSICVSVWRMVRNGYILLLISIAYNTMYSITAPIQNDKGRDAETNNHELE